MIRLGHPLNTLALGERNLTHVRRRSEHSGRGLSTSGTTKR